jgi:hypothetical protein
MSVCLSVCLHGTTLLPLDEFSWSLIFEDFSKICRENSSFIKIKHEKRVLYMTTCVYVCLYNLADFFLLWKMFYTKVVEKIKTHILWPIIFSENHVTYAITWEKYGTTREVTDNNIIWRTYISCWRHTHTHTHTLSDYVILIAFPQQQCLHERASLLHL